jgi:hypothetical protein
MLGGKRRWHFDEMVGKWSVKGEVVREIPRDCRKFMQWSSSPSARVRALEALL